jgi:hypothetical protein
MTQSATISALLIVAALVGLDRNTPTTAATTERRGFNAGRRVATPNQTVATRPTPTTPLSQENAMNKKQLAALLAAIVRATQTAADEVMATTEDEARTLVGMQLRRAASGLVQNAAGVEPETAAEHLKTAQDAIAAEAAAKKAAKADATDDGDDS